MPKNIVKTTGKLSEDKNTASFDFLLDDFYKDQVILVSVEKDSTKPTLKGFTNKKTYNKAITVSASDTSGIKSAKYKKNSGKYYSFKKERTFKTNGSYTVYAIDNFGNKTTKTFKIKDTARPTVSGVTTDKTYKSKRTITFKDNCGIEKATLNGKTVKSGVSVSKQGSYKRIVTDVNGLKRTVNFRIK